MVRFDVPEETAAGSATLVTEVHLPTGIRLSLKLESEIDRRKSATGDQVVARLGEDVRAGGVAIPAGSAAEGRIRDLRRGGDGRYVLLLEFSELRSAGVIAHFKGFVESIEKVKNVELHNSLTTPSELLVDERRFPVSGITLYYRTIAGAER